MNIIITGASRGIGFEMVKQFASDPQHSVLAISRNKEKLLGLKTECETQYPGCRVFVHSIDIASGDLQKELLPVIVRNMEKVDVLINNAGLLINKKFEEVNDEDFDVVFATNVKAIFRLTQSLLPFFPGGSHIVNISSMGGYQGSTKFPGLSLYSSSKGAVSILTECLAEELKVNRISVNCLALGAVQTEMLSDAFPGYAAPLNAGEMARYICQFAQTGHHFYNGKILPVALSTP